MDRDMEEVLRSQHAMLARKGTDGARLSPEGLARVFIVQLERVRAFLTEREIPTLCVSYAEALRSPADAAARVNRFLGGSLDEQAMARGVDPSLCRPGG